MYSVMHDAMSGAEVMGVSISRPAGIFDTSTNSAALQYEQQDNLFNMRPLNELSTNYASSLHQSRSRLMQKKNAVRVVLVLGLGKGVTGYIFV
jgi:hypothetical protein